MAQVKIEDVVDHLDTEFKKALEDTFGEFAPDISIDRSQVFRFFLKRVYQHCSVWETVPDNLVKNTN